MDHAKRNGCYSAELIRKLEHEGTLADIPEIPEDVRRLFQTALEIAPEDHLAIQAAFQKHVDNAVSKTINLPQAATAAEIAGIYQRAWSLGLKGVTVFRYGSRGEQVLNIGAGESADEHDHFVAATRTPANFEDPCARIDKIIRFQGRIGRKTQKCNS